jgi:hypothetical protein
MNKVVKFILDYLDNFVIVIINDILVYSKSLKEHEDHLRAVLQILNEKKLNAKFNKCEFCQNQVIFLRHVISNNRIFINHSKVDVRFLVQDQLGRLGLKVSFSFTGYYRKFVEGGGSLFWPCPAALRVAPFELIHSNFQGITVRCW